MVKLRNVKQLLLYNLTSKLINGHSYIEDALCQAVMEIECQHRMNPAKPFNTEILLFPLNELIRLNNGLITSISECKQKEIRSDLKKQILR